MSRAIAALTRVVVAIFILSIVLLTAAQQFARVGPWLLELSRYLPFPALLAPAVVALLVSFGLGRGWLLAASAALGLLVVVTMGLEWHGPDQGARPLRMMTYNIKAYLAREHADGYAKLAREVAHQHPDILVMQDAHGLPGMRTAAEASADAVFGLPHVHVLGQFVIASRFPLSDCAPGRVAPGDDQPRFLRCVVTVNGLAIDLVATHFESPREGLNAARREGLNGVAEWRHNYEDRLAQAQALAGDVRVRSRPLILAGDLNAPQLSPVVRSLLATDLRDAFASAGRGYGYTHGHALRLGFSFLRIDHILISPELGVTDCFAGGADASEHRPVIADLLLQRQPAR